MPHSTASSVSIELNLAKYSGQAQSRKILPPRLLVENLFQRMKVFRRVATRYDKLDVMFLGFVHFAGTMKWLH